MDDIKFVPTHTYKSSLFMKVSDCPLSKDRVIGYIKNFGSIDVWVSDKEDLKLYDKSLPLMVGVKQGDTVMIRDHMSDCWVVAIYLGYKEDCVYPYYACSGNYYDAVKYWSENCGSDYTQIGAFRYCRPLDLNLLGTTNE